MRETVGDVLTDARNALTRSLYAKKGSLTTKACFALSSTKSQEMSIIREVPLPDWTKDKAMKIGLYWILFLGQTIGDETILSHTDVELEQIVECGKSTYKEDMSTYLYRFPFMSANPKPL